MNEYGSPDPLRHEPGAPVPVVHRRTVDVVAGMVASVSAAAAGTAGAALLTPHDPFYGVIAIVAGVVGTVSALKIGLDKDDRSVEQSERDRVFRMLESQKISSAEARKMLEAIGPDATD